MLLAESRNAEYHYADCHDAESHIAQPHDLEDNRMCNYPFKTVQVIILICLHCRVLSTRCKCYKTYFFTPDWQNKLECLLLKNLSSIVFFFLVRLEPTREEWEGSWLCLQLVDKPEKSYHGPTL